MYQCTCTQSRRRAGLGPETLDPGELLRPTCLLAEHPYTLADSSSLVSHGVRTVCSVSTRTRINMLAASTRLADCVGGLSERPQPHTCRDEGIPGTSALLYEYGPASSSMPGGSLAVPNCFTSASPEAAAALGAARDPRALLHRSGARCRRGAQPAPAMPKEATACIVGC